MSAAGHRLIITCQVMPFWAAWAGDNRTRKSLEREGLIESRPVGSGWFVRLTAAGIKMRDADAVKRAEAASKRKYGR